MDKKRRHNINETLLQSEEDCKSFWASLLTETNSVCSCGISYKKYKFLEQFGKGTFEFYCFDGLYISITDVNLKQNLSFSGKRAYNTLELSYLIEGEQIISLNDNCTDLVYESQECYLLYLSDDSGKLSFNKDKTFKEVKIRMNDNFIKKHHLNEAYNLKETYTLSQKKTDFTSPLCPKKQHILSEILIDYRQGLLKRLFLESKVLELLALQLDESEHTITPYTNKNTIKKMYEIQHIITSDLTTQFSIQQLSRKIGLNDFVVKKEFKRVFGQTIFEYALEQRIIEAKKLLKYSQKPINEISECVGYKNATHFTASFKRKVGNTPKKYRITCT